MNNMKDFVNPDQEKFEEKKRDRKCIIVTQYWCHYRPEWGTVSVSLRTEEENPITKKPITVLFSVPSDEVRVVGRREKGENRGAASGYSYYLASNRV